MISRFNWNLQLVDHLTGAPIITAGGVVMVCKNGLPTKQAITDRDGVALSNALALTRGGMNFWATSLTNGLVDLYIMAPGGQFIVLKDVAPSGPNEIPVGSATVRQTAIIPFALADTAAAVETASGFTLPSKSQVLNRLHGCGLRVITLEAAKTIDVGTKEVGGAGGGDANGLIAASSLAAAGLVTGTDGALFTANAPYNSDAQLERIITYTLSAGTTVAAGFINFPYMNYVG